MNIEQILLTNESKINFLKGMIRISKCDGKKDESELIFYQQAANALGLSELEKEKLYSVWVDDEEIEVEFENNTEKMFFFIQGIQLCWIDGSYEEAERNEMRKLADELNISIQAIEAVEQWVEEGIRWNHRGNSLLELS